MLKKFKKLSTTVVLCSKKTNTKTNLKTSLKTNLKIDKNATRRKNNHLIRCISALFVTSSGGTKNGCF